MAEKAREPDGERLPHDETLRHIYGLSPEDRDEAAALHLGRNRLSGEVEEGLGEVEVGDEVRIHAPRLHLPRPAREQRRAQRFLEKPPLVEPAMLAEVEALVGGVDDDGVLRETLVVEEAPDFR